MLPTRPRSALAIHCPTFLAPLPPPEKATSAHSLANFDCKRNRAWPSHLLGGQGTARRAGVFCVGRHGVGRNGGDVCLGAWRRGGGEEAVGSGVRLVQRPDGQFRRERIEADLHQHQRRLSARPRAPGRWHGRGARRIPPVAGPAPLEPSAWRRPRQHGAAIPPPSPVLPPDHGRPAGQPRVRGPHQGGPLPPPRRRGGLRGRRRRETRRGEGAGHGRGLVHWDDGATGPGQPRGCPARQPRRRQPGRRAACRAGCESRWCPASRPARSALVAEGRHVALEGPGSLGPGRRRAIRPRSAQAGASRARAGRGLCVCQRVARAIPEHRGQLARPRHPGGGIQDLASVALPPVLVPPRAPRQAPGAPGWRAHLAELRDGFWHLPDARVRRDGLDRAHQAGSAPADGWRGQVPAQAPAGGRGGHCAVRSAGARAPGALVMGSRHGPTGHAGLHSSRHSRIGRVILRSR